MNSMKQKPLAKTFLTGLAVTILLVWRTSHTPLFEPYPQPYNIILNYLVFISIVAWAFYSFKKDRPIFWGILLGGGVFLLLLVGFVALIAYSWRSG